MLDTGSGNLITCAINLISSIDFLPGHMCTHSSRNSNQDSLESSLSLTVPLVSLSLAYQDLPSEGFLPCLVPALFQVTGGTEG